MTGPLDLRSPPIGRRVLVSVSRWSGLSGLSELMRTAVALASGFRGHQVEIALIGEGVLTALQPREDSWNRYYRAARAFPIPIYAEKESLERLMERMGLKTDDLTVEVQPMSRKEMVDLCRRAEHQLRL
ncbi:MAG: DsrE family protein [Candidatus Eremiobacterota bacterium]